MKKNILFFLVSLTFASFSVSIQTKEISTSQKLDIDLYFNEGIKYFETAEVARKDRELKKAEENYTSAINFFNKAIDTLSLLPTASYPNDIKQKIAKIYKLRGDSYKNISSFDKAIENYNKAIELAPDYLNAYIEKGNALVESDNYESAVKSFNEALKISSSSADVYYGLGLCYERLKNEPMSAMAYLKAFKLGNLEAQERFFEKFKIGEPDSELKDEIETMGNLYGFLNLFQKEIDESIDTSSISISTNNLSEIKELNKQLFLFIGKILNMETNFSDELKWREESKPLTYLSMIRAGLNVYYADNEGKFPQSLDELVPKYITEIPTIHIKEHNETSKITIYKSDILIKGKNYYWKIDHSKIKDTGGYGYIYEENSPYSGIIFIDCIHKNSKGIIWSDY